MRYHRSINQDHPVNSQDPELKNWVSEGGLIEEIMRSG